MKSLFVHIPKTAGTTITEVMQMYRRSRRDGANKPFEGVTTFQHMTHEKIGHLLDPELFIFTFVRNPYDRAVSLWTVYGKGQSFAEYLIGLQHKHTLVGKPQTFWFEGFDFDFIGRYERLERDIRAVAETVGAPINGVVWRNKSEHEPYYKCYDDQTKALVLELYAEDFNRLSYDTEV